MSLELGTPSTWHALALGWRVDKVWALGYVVGARAVYDA